MSLITWNTGVNAPCAGEILGQRVWVDEGRRSKRGEPVKTRVGDSALVQTDWDYPGVAQTFGWDIRSVQQEGREEPCGHDGTDGTVTCPECGLKAGDFICAAGIWLEDHDGATAEDPGVFLIWSPRGLN
jgi:hypothetical protein